MSERPAPQQARAAKTRVKLLDAAATVVRRDGIQAMTLARVAEEGRVEGWPAASLRLEGGARHRHARADALRRASGLDELTAGRERGAFAKAYLEYVRRPDEHQADAATAVFAAAAAGDGELGPAADVFEAWQQRLMHEDGLDPALGLLARIVGDGLWLIDLFGLARPSAEDRAQ